MATAVYLSDRSLMAAEGRGDSSHIAIQKIAVFELAPGIIQGGTVVNAHLLIKQLKELRMKSGFSHKKVFVIVNSPRIYTRLLRLPLVSERKLRELLPLEFGTNERMKEPVYDYRILQSDSRTHMTDCLASVADSEFLNVYAEVFEEAGISLAGIGSAIDSQCRMLSYLSCIQEKNSIVQVVEGDTLISMLLFEGTLIHFNKSRIFPERDSKGFAAEIERNVSTLAQYFKSLHKERILTQVYLGGLSANEELHCKETLSRLGLTASVIKQENAVSMPAASQYTDMTGRLKNPAGIGDFLFLAGGLIEGKGNQSRINLYEQLRKKRFSKGNSKRRLLLPYAALVCAGAAGIGGLALRQMWLKSQLQKYEDNLNNPSFQENYKMALHLMEENEALSELLENMDGLAEYKNSYPSADSALLERIHSCALPGMEVVIREYDSADGTLILEAGAKQNSDCSDFIQALWETEVFEDILYRGYSQNEDGEYTLSLTCILKGSTDKGGKT